MSTWKVVVPTVVAACLAASLACASTACDSAFTQQFHDCIRIVDSLRPDKGGQVRVFAADGSEFTAGQARWMQGQLQLVDKACARGDQVGAVKLLTGVQELIKAHQKTP